MTTVARRVPRIIGVATATPRRRFTQAELLDLAGYRDSRRRGFFEHGDIETRALHLDPARIRAGETIDDLQQRYREAALDLGERAVRAALMNAGWQAADVDFLATTTRRWQRRVAPTRSDGVPRLGRSHPRQPSAQLGLRATKCGNSPGWMT